MRRRHLITALLALPTALSGCTGQPAGPARSTGRPTASPADESALIELQQAVDRTLTATHRLTARITTPDRSGPLTSVDGVVDPVAKRMEVSVRRDSPGELVTVRQVGPDYYVRGLGGPDARPWARLDGVYLENDQAMADAVAATGFDWVLAGLVSAERVDRTTYRAVVDLRQARDSTTSASVRRGLERLSGTGGSAGLPLTATLSTDGALAGFTFDARMSVDGTTRPVTTSVTYRDIGLIVNVARPAGSVTRELRGQPR